MKNVESPKTHSKYANKSLIASKIFRHYKSGERDFQGVILRGQSFKGKDLSGADFSHSDIRGVNFSYTNLTDANFTHALAGLSRYWIIVAYLFSIIVGFLEGFVAAWNTSFLHTFRSRMYVAS